MLADRRAPAGDAPPLLRFAGVTKHVRDGDRRVSLLHDVSFELYEGASVGLYGAPRSGKSTLLRLACAIDLADAGAVCFSGRDLAILSGAERAALLRRDVALVSEDAWQPTAGETALDRVATSLGGTGATLRQARRRALAALDRIEAAGYAAEPAASLSRAQRSRVELASALVREPRLLLVDEPVCSPSPAGRERLCALMRDAAQERGIALLIASEDVAALQGLQTLMSISAGELCSTATSSPGATLVSLAARRAATGSGA